jgi:peptide chain release factor subunit 1
MDARVTAAAAGMIDGKPTRRSPDVIDELVAVVIDEGGSAKHVEVDTKLSEYLVAAELRFPLPPSAVSP